MVLKFPVICLLSFSLSALAQGQTAATATSVAPDAPLPPVATLLHDVEQNQDAADAARKDYTYRVHDEQQDLDSKGNLKKTETRDADSFRVDGVLVNRTTAKNGKPLTPDEQKKESERIDKEVSKEKDRREKLKSEGKSTDNNGDQVLTLSRILQLGTFTNERRVDLNGRQTIAVDYQGDPNVKTKTRLETIFRDIVGTIWIDEQDRTIVQLQGHFIDDFKIGGGLLADIKKGSSFNAIFRKINDEVWLPEKIEGDGHIRVLLFANFNGRFITTASDYRKYRTTTKLIPTNREVDENGNPVPTTPDKTPQ
jgi:hypothetical protein